MTDIELSDYQFNIISRLKQIRLDNDITQSEMSKILGISAGQLGNIESPKFPHKYTLKQIYTICKTLNYPIEKVFCVSDTTGDVLSRINNLMERIIEYENNQG